VRFRLAKQRRALVETNPPGNSQPELHPDDERWRQFPSAAGRDVSRVVARTGGWMLYVGRNAPSQRVVRLFGRLGHSRLGRACANTMMATGRGETFIANCFGNLRDVGRWVAAWRSGCNQSILPNLSGWLVVSSPSIRIASPTWKRLSKPNLVGAPRRFGPGTRAEPD